jgi:ABC-2 type transport system ATP-binding protein
VIALHGLSFRYPRQARYALHDIDLQIRRGSLFGLLGQNGSGKTTLIALMNGLLSPTSGTVAIDGHGLDGRTHAMQAVSSLVPQENAFYPTLTVAENLEFFARVQGIDTALRATRMEEVIGIARLEQALTTTAGRLSGGLKRRLSIAIGLLNKPQLLFLDEPTASIDPQSREFLLDAIRRINADGTTIVYSSHYMDEVEQMCDEIAILDDGAILVQGSLGTLLSQAGGQRLGIETAEPIPQELCRTLGALPHVQAADCTVAMTQCSPSQLQQVLDTLATAGVAVTAVQYGKAGLQDLFMSLTGFRPGDAS